MLSMEPLKIIVEAIKIEAKRKPDERIYYGTRSMTYREFAEKVDKVIEKNDNDSFIKDFLAYALKKFNDNPSFQKAMKSIVGENS